MANDIRVSRITPLEDGHSALMHSTLFIVAVEVLVSLELQVRASRKLSADSENSGDSDTPKEAKVIDVNN